MSPGDEDDKPTVVLDLNALKRQKLAEEERLGSIEDEIEFDVHTKSENHSTVARGGVLPQKDQLKVVLFDFQSDFFRKSIAHFPNGFDYIMTTTLDELNNCLRTKENQIVVLNYDVNAKAINQLSAQIKMKFLRSKVLILARAISPEKAKMHAQTPAGASGYYQLPLDAERVRQELEKISSEFKKIG